MLESLNQVKYTSSAKDFQRYEQTKRVDVISFSYMAGELHQNLILAVGKRVMLTENFDVSDGVVNSATGVVIRFPNHNSCLCCSHS